MARINSQYLNCRGDAGGRVPRSRVSVPPSRLKRWMVRRKRLNFSPNFGKKPLQFPAKTFFFGVHLISATELRNLLYSTFACQMRLVKAAKASPHAKFYNLSTVNSINFYQNRPKI